jgi:ERCC4-type nuclease
MTPEPITLICDTREPWPHPWAKWLPSHVTLERRCLPTGDLCLKGFEQGALCERKTITDLLGCIGSSRERFEAELQRASALASFAVVVEGSFRELGRQSRGIATAAITGSIAAWTRRHCPFVFCDTERGAALFALRFLAGQRRDAERVTGQADPPPYKESFNVTERARVSRGR